MDEIHGDARTVRQLFKGVKYSIDYYQREYKWQDKQIKELMDDLSGKFLMITILPCPGRKLQNYPHYFLGSIILSKKEEGKYIDMDSSALPV